MIIENSQKHFMFLNTCFIDLSDHCQYLLGMIYNVLYKCRKVLFRMLFLSLKQIACNYNNISSFFLFSYSRVFLFNSFQDLVGQYYPYSSLLPILVHVILQLSHLRLSLMNLPYCLKLFLQIFHW